MGASKVIVDGETIVDLTGDSATPETVAEGETFHDANGEPRVGTMTTAPVVQTTGDSDTSVMSQRAVTEALGEKVDAEEGMGLSHNDYTDEEKQKVAQAQTDSAEAKERAEALAQKVENGELKGDDGKSAYQYAQDGGYTGTEEDFARQMAVEIVYNDSLNLFDINDPDVTRGYYLTGEGYQGGDVGCAITGYIPVDPNTKYTRSAGATIFHTIEYTKDKTVIGRVSATKTFTTSANAAYVRATVIITQTPLETYMFVKGDTLPSVYIPYGNSLIIAGHNIPLGEEVEESDSATITKWGVIGDSLSNQPKWQTTACGILRLTGYEKNAITGAYVADYGDGGDASANAFVNRYLNTPADCDLITIMGGTNDATYKCGDGIGEIGTLNTNTFFGAYCTIIEGLLERNPAVRIMLFTPPRCYTAQGVLNPHLALYVEAVKSIAEHYDLPCLDLYNNLGINDKTFDTLLPDYVHFSDALGYRVGRVIGNFVKNNY